MRSSRHLTIVIFAAISCLPFDGRAQQSEAEAAAAAHDERATALFEEGQFTRALVEMQAAQELLPATSRVYNIGTCHERLGDLTQAIVYYQRFIEASDAPDDRKQVAQERIDELRRQLQAEGGTDDEGPGTDDVVSETDEGDDQRTPPQETSSRRNLSPAIFSSLLGVTAATGIALAATGGIALYWQGEFTDTIADSPEGAADQERGEPYATASDVLIGVTAAGALATLIVGLLTRWRSSNDVSRTPCLTIGSSSLTLSGAF